ncbi:MAG: hypothetical protein U0164_20575 [Gemmatimonadaceae bacterium]
MKLFHRWAATLALSLLSAPLVAQAPQRALNTFAAEGLADSSVRATLRASVIAPNIASNTVAPSACHRNGGDRARQFVVGLVGAWAVGLVAFKAIDDPGGPGRKVKGDAGYTPNANTAYALGSWLGSAGGVYWAGRQHACGSFSKTLLLTGLPTIPLLLLRDEPYLPVIGVVLGAPVQSLVATAAYPK